MDLARLALAVDSRQVKAATNDLNALRAATRGAAGSTVEFERNQRRAATASETFRRNLIGMQRVLATVGVALGARQVLAYADAWTQVSNRLRAAGVAQEEVARTQARLADLAVDTRGNLDSTAALYARLTQASEALGVSQERVIGVVRTVNQATAVFGASTSEAASTVRQLSQALASGTLRGDEFNSIMENATPLALAIADHVGVGIGELRRMAEEGVLTSTLVFDAIEAGAAKIEEAFDATQLTVGQAFQVLQTRAIEFVGTTNETLGVTNMLADALVVLSDNLDIVAAALGLVAARLIAPVLIAWIANVYKAVAATLVWDRAAIGLSIRLSAANAAATLLSRTVAFFLGPIGLALTAAGVAIGIMASRNDEAAAAAASHAAEVDTLRQKYEDAGRAAEALTRAEAERLLLSYTPARRAQLDEDRQAAEDRLAALLEASVSSRFTPAGDPSGIIADFEALDQSVRTFLQGVTVMTAQAVAAGEEGGFVLADIAAGLTAIGTSVPSAREDVEAILGMINAIIAARGEVEEFDAAEADLQERIAGVLPVMGDQAAQAVELSAAYRMSLDALRALNPALALMDERSREIAEATAAHQRGVEALNNQFGDARPAQYVEAMAALDAALAQALQSIDPIPAALEEARAALEAFQEQTQKSTDLSERIADIRSQTEALAQPLIDLLASGVVEVGSEAFLALSALSAEIGNTGWALEQAAVAADSNAFALQSAEAQAAAFSDAMAQLEGIAVSSMSAGEEAAYAFELALLKASNEADRLAAKLALVRAQARIAEQAADNVGEFIEGLERSVAIAGIASDRERTIARAVESQRAELALMGDDAAAAQERIEELAGAEWDLIEAQRTRTQTAGRAATAGRRDAEAAAEAWDKALESVDEQIEGIRRQIEQVGLSTEAQAEYARALARTTAERNLLEAAERSGGIVSEAENAAIRERIALLQAEQEALAAAEEAQREHEERTEKIANAFGNVLDAVLSFVDGTKTGLDILISAAAKAQSFFAQQAKQAAASGNWAMTAVFAVAAIISAIVKRRAEERKQLLEAQKQWAEMEEERQRFVRMLNGEGTGTMTGALADTRESLQKFVDAAIKAKQPIDELQRAWTTFVTRQVRDFRASFGANVWGLESGLGLDNPASQAIERVREIGEELKGFINDVETSEAIMKGTGRQASDLAAQYGKLTVAQNDNSQAVERARQASIKMALSLLDTPPELSEVATRFYEIRGLAIGLQGVLEDLGLTSEEARRQIEEGVSKALADLRDNFQADITARLNELRGKGYINQVHALLDQVDQMMSDAALLGLGNGQIADFLIESLQAIVDQAGLTGDAFADFIAMFPEFASVLQESTTEIERSMDRVNGIARGILDYVNDLRGGGNSVLSPVNRLAEAQAMFRSQLALAGSGNLDAASSITKYADDALKAAREVYASGPEFQALFNQITEALLTLPVVEDADDPVVVALRDVLNALYGIDQTIKDSPEILAETIAPLFDDIDINKDGLLSGEELRDVLGLTNNEIRQLREAIDFNGDAYISAQEVALGELGITIAKVADAVAEGPAALWELIEPAFDVLDTNTDGLLTYDELKSGLNLSDADMKRFFDAYDLNGDGVISAIERDLANNNLNRQKMINAIKEGDAAKIRDALLPSFNRIDANLDGLLDKKELQDVLGLTNAEVLKLIDLFDADGDGQLSKLELLNKGQKDLGKTTENINETLATDYWGPMADSLGAIEAYTKIMANQANQPKPGFFRRLFPKLFGAEDGGHLPGLAAGGIVANGFYNQDSVRARFLDGGEVMLAGNEYVTQATSVNPGTLSMLDFINRTGQVPANNNSGSSSDAMAVMMASARRDTLDIVQATRESGALVARVVGEAMAEIRDGLDDLSRRAKLRDSRAERSVVGGRSSAA